MDYIYIEINTLYYLQLFVTDLNGDPKIGLTTTFTIYKSSDNSVITSGSLTDIGNGVYQSSYTFSTLEQYYILYTTPSGYTNGIESIIVEEEGAKSDTLLRVLGLSKENQKIVDMVHDSNHNLLSSTIRLYPSATDFENDTNVLAIYEMTATYNALNEAQFCGFKRIL